jgi:hypothetical protein
MVNPTIAKGRQLWATHENSAHPIAQRKGDKGGAPIWFIYCRNFWKMRVKSHSFWGRPLQ